MASKRNSEKVRFYRDRHLPFFELKHCSTGELSYRKHTHEEYSVGIVEQGKSFFWYGGKTSVIAPKTVVFLPPDLIHSCNPFYPGQWAYSMLFVNAAWVERFMNSHSNYIFNQPVIREAPVHEASFELNTLLETLSTDVIPLEKEASIMSFFERHLTGRQTSRNDAASLEQPKLKLIREYLQSCFLEKITLDQLEEASGLNKFHIIRLFKQFFKIPPHTYQTLLRVNYAKKELRKHRPLTEVALAAGFYDQSHFTKVFKAHTGVTPDGYQKYI